MLKSRLLIFLADIKADNILNELVDGGVLEAFTKAELEAPSPRKFTDGTPVYLSRRFERPRKYGDAVLGDFGSAVRGDVKRNHDAQPNVYRSPEVMLRWSGATRWIYGTLALWSVRSLPTYPSRRDTDLRF